MPNVNVTRDSMEKVKRILQQFKTDMEHIPHSVMQSAAAALSECERQINDLKNRIMESEQEISRLEAGLGSLRSSEAANQAKINEYESQNRSYNSKLQMIKAEKEYMSYISELDEKVRKNEGMIKELEMQNYKIGNETSSLENELQEKRNEAQRKRNKLESMQSAFYNIQSETENLNSMIRAFSGHALNDAASGIAGVNQCIQFIDEYMSTNL